eukprot:TRINITY_DN17115_c0_g1_i1.p1 TRINITY_DN17115_c0_g1~~TRINITY_DN17115_c0_g1_i1.p1  ORF type:complete len:179 (-),score=43.69 TRINITY_DN17115_c0_g1_i1:187-654(-)
MECSTIVTDSSSFVFGSEGYLSFTSATGIEWDESEIPIQLEGDGEEAGSSCITFQCAECKTTLGRIFKTSSCKDIDILRNNFTFDWQYITKFSFGGRQTPIEHFNLEEKIIELRDAVNEQLGDFQDMQSLIIYLANKLKQLEQVNERLEMLENRT